MKLRFLIYLCLAFVQTLYAQVTFVVNQLPDNHDYAESLYISGDFEGWSGGQDAFKLKKKDTTYSITLNLDQDIFLYKFTRGSWDSVEKDAEGQNTDNRTYKKSSGQGTVFVQIVRWDKADEDGMKQSTASRNVSVLSESFEISELNRKRRVWMYLPPDYHVTEERYPVLYMHDAQNVFDDLTSYSGEWGVDETLNKLFRLHNLRLIVVAIDNGGDNRMTEYSAWDNERFGKGEGEAYINFITKTLKPYIDANFRTKKDAGHTGIMGSSMGGLISHYAALKYPDVYGKAGVFSPSFWYATGAYDLAEDHSNISDSQMYFLVGGNEGDTMVPDMVRMIDIMKSKGFPEVNIQQKIVEEGIHNEKFWKEEFEEAILWLFPDAIKQREFVSYSQINNQLHIEVSDGNYIIQYYTPEIIETNFIPNGQSYNTESHAVNIKSKDLIESIVEEENSVMITSPRIDILIQKAPFKISYNDKERNILSEGIGYQKNDEHETLQFYINEDEILYGGGARALGMNRRGHRLKLYNRAHYGYETESELMNYTIPIVISSNKYMLHFDNAPIGYLDLDSKSENTLTYETISGRKTYQIIVGDTWEDLIGNYTNLTGKQPLPPRWALGNFSSRFGYHSQKETEHTINKFKQENIPVDAIILDLYWFGKDIQGTMGNLEVFRDSFPDFEGMVQRLEQKGVKTIPITEPFVLTTSKRWDEAVENNVLATDSTEKPARYDFYFGNTGIIDIYKKEGEDWFWNIYKSLADKGVAGVWGDLGEPEVHPSWVQHATGTADEVHNTYGHDWARLVYEGYARDFPDQRPFILMRAGYSGTQRYGMIPWSGDVNRTWGGFQSQTEIALQMGMQGLAYMHSDLGGFAGANLDDELYTRWLQYGVFQPIYRPHAQEDVPSEPIFREPRTRKLAKQSIELRYRLLPYNYNLSFENSTTGVPLMRPLLFEEPDNKEVFTNASTYLWGKDFLVTPVMTSAATEVEVYFPENNYWFDYYTDEIVTGGDTKNVKTEEASIPTYVRAAAFIPTVEVVQTTDDYTLNEFALHYYHHASVSESQRSFYNDDGLTKNAFEKGLYEILLFAAEIENDELEIEFEAEIGSNYTSENKKINLILHNIEVEPKKIIVGKKRFKKFDYNNEKRTLAIPVEWNTSKELEINIKLEK